MGRAASTTVMTVMVPSCMWIVVAWLALWLNRDQLVGRIFLVCLSLYALSEISRQVNAEVPRVAYTKAIDTWNGTCVLFAFIALVEVLVIGCMHTPVIKKEEESSQWRGPAFLHRLRSSPGSNKLEIALRILNPLIFVLLFIVPYFVTYAGRQTVPCGNNIKVIGDTVCE